MPLIELPRALEDYFAFAETEPTRRGRRFSITLPFHNGDKLERLQWWYHVSPAEEQMFEGHGLLVLRVRGIQRFCRHIERWLEINRLRMHGEEPIPRLSSQQQLLQPQVVEPSPPGMDVLPTSRHPVEVTARVSESPAAVAQLPDWPLIKAISA